MFCVCVFCTYYNQHRYRFTVSRSLDLCHIWHLHSTIMINVTTRRQWVLLCTFFPSFIFFLYAQMLVLGVIFTVLYLKKRYSISVSRKGDHHRFELFKTISLVCDAMVQPRFSNTLRRCLHNTITHTSIGT